tara:strand:- start:758 stop:1084 length:327 start_codon:yes stop_codon:yes gene_type:complete
MHLSELLTPERFFIEKAFTSMKVNVYDLDVIFDIMVSEDEENKKYVITVKGLYPEATKSEMSSFIYEDRNYTKKLDIKLLFDNAIIGIQNAINELAHKDADKIKALIK